MNVSPLGAFSCALTLNCGPTVTVGGLGLPPNSKSALESFVVNLLPSISKVSVVSFSAYAVLQLFVADPKLKFKSILGVIPDVTSALKLISSVSASPSLTNDPAIVALPSVVKFPVIFVVAFMFTVFSAELIFKSPTKLSSVLSLSLIKSVLTLVSSIVTVLPPVTTVKESVLLKSMLADCISVFPVS